MLQPLPLHLTLKYLTFVLHLLERKYGPVERILLVSRQTLLVIGIPAVIIQRDFFIPCHPAAVRQPVQQLRVKFHAAASYRYIQTTPVTGQRVLVVPLIDQEIAIQHLHLRHRSMIRIPGKPHGLHIEVPSLLLHPLFLTQLRIQHQHRRVQGIYMLIFHHSPCGIQTCLRHSKTVIQKKHLRGIYICSTFDITSGTLRHSYQPKSLFRIMQSVRAVLQIEDVCYIKHHTGLIVNIGSRLGPAQSVKIIIQSHGVVQSSPDTVTTVDIIVKHVDKRRTAIFYILAGDIKIIFHRIDILCVKP